MEYLSRHLTSALQNNSIKGIKVVALSPAINHLLFADDCLIFTQADVTSVNNLLEFLHHFSTQLGEVILKSQQFTSVRRLNLKLLIH